MQVLITANSPGELAGWAKPVIFALKKNNPELKIRIILLPCTFASGHEYTAAKEIKGVEEVY
ncbi:MAG: lipid-A-disaccharide synthase, partial [Armatimonadetes bacterium]|nr:lipid-A-disaccharide synthase [Armatimonadota bacterium]